MAFAKVTHPCMNVSCRKFEDAKAAEQISRQIDKDEKKAMKQVRDMFKKFE